MKNRILLFLLITHFVLFIQCGQKTPEQPIAEPVQNKLIIDQYQVIGQLDHDPDAFTQGLIFHNNSLIESTGQFGTSRILTYDLSTGAFQEKVKLNNDLFGEGIALLNGMIYQLTWKNNKGFVYDLNTFELVNEFDYPFEGWGITTDGAKLIISDGTNTLRFMDPETLAVTSNIQITDYNGLPLKDINELEYYKNGLILANIWFQNQISVIDTRTGREVKKIDLSSIARNEIDDEEKVLNGIAYDGMTDTFYLTGKNWKKIYVLKIPELSEYQATLTPKM